MFLEELVEILDTILAPKTFDDIALNGLQVEACDEVERLAVAVDASTEAVEEAAEWDADMLLCHHGLFWGKARPITGPLALMLKKMFDHGISLYASHLPLDAHPEIGNSACLGQLLGLEDIRPFGTYRGQSIGFVGSLPEVRPVRDVLNALGESLDGIKGSALHGPPRVERVAVVSGGAGSLVAEAVDANVDLMVTGETEHTSAVFAKESSLNVAFFGHYATETLGVKALAEKLESEHSIVWKFVGKTTGL